MLRSSSPLRAEQVSAAAKRRWETQHERHKKIQTKFIQQAIQKLWSATMKTSTLMRYYGLGEPTRRQLSKTVKIRGFYVRYYLVDMIKRQHDRLGTFLLHMAPWKTHRLKLLDHWRGEVPKKVQPYVDMAKLAEYQSKDLVARFHHPRNVGEIDFNYERTRARRYTDEEHELYGHTITPEYMNKEAEDSKRILAEREQALLQGEPEKVLTEAEKLAVIFSGDDDREWTDDQFTLWKQALTPAEQAVIDDRRARSAENTHRVIERNNERRKVLIKELEDNGEDASHLRKDLL
jgi:hypothetical protein